jgi:hypothetical protein
MRGGLRGTFISLISLFRIPGPAGDARLVSVGFVIPFTPGVSMNSELVSPAVRTDSADENADETSLVSAGVGSSDSRILLSGQIPRTSEQPPSRGVVVGPGQLVTLVSHGSSVVDDHQSNVVDSVRMVEKLV